MSSLAFPLHSWYADTKPAFTTLNDALLHYHQFPRMSSRTRLRTKLRQARYRPAGRPQAKAARTRSLIAKARRAPRLFNVCSAIKTSQAMTTASSQISSICVWSTGCPFRTQTWSSTCGVWWATSPQRSGFGTNASTAVPQSPPPRAYRAI